MFLWLILLFIFLPWIELLLLFRLADLIGGWETLGVIILTGVIGASLARWQGFQTVMRIRSELDHGSLPADALLDGLFILCAGLLLITPGLLTDATGFTLLAPPARTLIKKTAKRYIQTHFQVAQFGSFTERADRSRPRNMDQDVIDVDATEINDTESDDS